MNKRFFIIAVLATMLSPLAVFAQAPKTFTPPRTPWGEPDLQGTFSNRTITPFERPANVAGRGCFTAEEGVGASLDLIIPERLRKRDWDALERVIASGVTR